jgi:hypothetical protein
MSKQEQCTKDIFWSGTCSRGTNGCNDDHPEDLIAEIARLRKIEADARVAGLIDEKGNVRKVLGQTWLTDDGAIIGKDAEVWVLCRPVVYDLVDDQHEWKACPARMGHNPDDALAKVPWWNVTSPPEWKWCEGYEISGVYSTEAAAEAARNKEAPNADV